MKITTAECNNNTSTAQLTDQQRASPVNRMFDGRSVFVTGASGFIGRVLLEKLLRTYRGIDKIYILMRPKRNVPVKERLHRHLLDLPIFDQIKSLKDGQQLLEKIIVIPGDIGEPNLGISERDLDSLLADESLSIVFHSAATVKFDEPLKVAIKYNLEATEIMLDFCRKLKNLISLCHVSTAYVNSHLKDSVLIEEKLYPMQQKPQDLLKLAEVMDDHTMQDMKFDLIGERPNTYTYTKALAEHLITSRAADLPVAIVRPSIVVAAWKEPIPGWIDNLNGPTGLMLAFGKGLLRSLYASRSCKADIIPVDIAVNQMIAAAYYAAKTHNKLDRTTTGLGTDDAEQQQQHGQSEAIKQPTIFHCSSGGTNPITWGNIESVMFPLARSYPSETVLRYPFGSFKGSRRHDLLTRMFVHYLPALVIDLVSMVLGRKAQLLSIYCKMHSAIGALTHFCTTDYNFQSKNLQLLENCLTGSDKQELYLSIKPLHWPYFFKNYFLGIRRFILNEPESSIERARKSLRRAFYIEMSFRVFLVTLVLGGGFSFYSRMVTVAW